MGEREFYELRITMKFNSFQDALKAQREAAQAIHNGLVVHESSIIMPGSVEHDQ